jgi:addiction module HigA family antidote
MRISHVVNGSRPVTAELALRFGKAFGQSPQYWLNLQALFDLEVARDIEGEILEGIQELKLRRIQRP